jgi:hypothetical protein
MTQPVCEGCHKELKGYRIELLEYYERRGYVFKGKTFPLNPDLWTLKVEHLDLKIIEKIS